MADRWVRMTEEEYAKYKSDADRVESAWCEGYDRGWKDRDYFFQSYTKYDEQENDENFNE